MSFESLTEVEIQRLISLPKRATNAVQAKTKQRPNTQHEECNIRVVSDDGQESFTFYTRQNLKLKRDFSCGLTWNSAGGDLVLLRLNGSGHFHPPIGVVCHIHRASEKAIQDKKKPESIAEATKSYDSLEGAKHKLVSMACISGIPAPAPHPQLLS